MTSGSKTPPARPPPKDSDDAWTRVQREVSAAIRGVDPDIEELGDTAATMAGAADAASESVASNDILDLVNSSLAAEPDRADLWMMRFDIQKTLGLRAEFSDALVQGWNHPKLGRTLDWIQIGEMWEVLAPGEPTPQGIKLPSAVQAPVSKQPDPGGKPVSQRRRFSDTALTLAARELTILSKAYGALHSRPDYFKRMSERLGPMIRRPTPLYFAEQTTRNWGGNARIFFKREDQRRVTPEAEYSLAQAWLGLQMGRGILITGNDVDAHSLGLAVAAKHFGLQCTVAVKPRELEEKPGFMAKLRALGASIEAPSDPKCADDDPRVTAIRLWQSAKGSAHLALSLGWGPGPFPSIVNDFQSLLGREVESQLLATAAAEYPTTLVASVGSEADAIGFVLPQLNNPAVELVFAEPEPGGINSWRPSQRLKHYNGARREHSWLHATNRITHVAIADSQALAMQQQSGSLENIQLSLEDARSVALAALLARRATEPRNVVVLAA